MEKYIFVFQSYYGQKYIYIDEIMDSIYPQSYKVLQYDKFFKQNIQLYCNRFKYLIFTENFMIKCIIKFI